MTHGDLFAGIGGFALAAQRVGIETKWMVEIDEFCRAVYAKHFPWVKQYGDIKEVQEIEYVDLITGGFPCQPVSLAGRQKGTSDPRWLWPEFARVIALVRPKYVLVENVPGLLGNGMGDILVDLASCGYDAEWDCIPAALVGAPHLRTRVWLVAYPSTSRRLRTEQPQDSHSCSPGQGADDIDPKTSLSADASAERSQGSMFDWLSSLPKYAANGIGGIPEPDVDRVVHGVPNRVDRIGALGNAIVPQVAEYILHQIKGLSDEKTL